jgi:CBS domain-containing membrane protein|uniref:CBS domain-containing protein n=1 Tax=Desulfobacca acetoxidans TaxID=60893 RepID=A0A7V6A1H0_9BACT
MVSKEGSTGSGSRVKIDLKEEDIVAAMQEIPGYLDITPRDFKEIYTLAFQHALERLKREVTVAEIMTREVAAVKPDTPLADVAGAMGRRGVSGVPVVDDGNRVVGVVSEKDFLRRMGVVDSQNFMTLVASCLRSKGCVALPIKKQTAGELMSSPAVTVRPETRVRDLAELFAARHINRAPVTDAEGRLVGIVSRGDLVKATLAECRV